MGNLGFGAGFAVMFNASPAPFLLVPKEHKPPGVDGGGYALRDVYDVLMPGGISSIFTRWTTTAMESAPRRFARAPLITCVEALREREGLYEIGKRWQLDFGKATSTLMKTLLRQA